MKTISKQIIGLTIIGSSLFLPNIAQAITVEEVINPREDNGGWVTDMANILSTETELQLNQIINNLEINNGTEIAVVTVPDTNSHPTPKAFTTELFNHWGIGKADVDNGVLFLISSGDRRIEIETGYGIEPILPNTEVQEIIDTKITPEFKQGNYDRGTLAGTKVLSDRLQTEVDHNIQKSSIVFLIFIGFVIWLYLISKSLSFPRKKRSRRYNNSSDSFGGGSSNGSGASSSWGSSSSGCDSGGGSFGGGSSDGGGGGGSW
jgi:uncharacterized protein